jgi:FKBP-type peptidyl-prolyl cis-trans isomerase
MKRIPKIAVLSGLLTLGLCGSTFRAPAQAKKAPVKKIAAKTSSSSAGFKKLPSGLEYKIVKHGKGTRKPKLNDHIEMNIHVHIGDSVIFDSRKMYNNKPVPFPISQPKFKGDPIEGFMMMVTGDSAVFKLSVDSLKKAGNQLLPWMKEGMKIEYDVALVSVKTDEEEKRDVEKKTAEQKIIDEKLLQEYFTKHNIKPMKTASGLYYTINQQGSGPLPKIGQIDSVNYTGKLLNGKAFDSNTDSAFNHVTPLPVELGKGRVIKGWEEGLALFNKGTKATLYIPSNLAYGSQDRSPTIPANSVLVFDVDIVDIQTPVNQSETDDKLIRDYLQKNNIQANRTPSGLYYSISQEGSGDNAKPGQKVSVFYTGKTMDGKTFDSNVGKSPFNVNLGSGGVIRGWEDGLQNFKKGTKGTLYIPSGMAYGPQGHPPVIPQNAVLIFDIEVTDISK